MAEKKKRKLPAAFLAKLTPSAKLAAVIGPKPITRAQALKGMWDYFKKHKLNHGREINADATLRPIFGKDKITMFDVGKILKVNLSK
ncbi:MAG: SWIB/MDM2 domain-containing protein [Planctomycetota bacterium]|nr:SWIB/MDM2 domain-containing protein [Planctomycetota bacterium]